MAIILDNRLNGPVGQEVTNASLAASGFQGTVTGLSLGERAVYSDTRTVHDFSTIELSTGYHRDDTPRFRVDLPPTGPWSARWYVWMPNMQDAGHGINEVRWHCRFPETGMGYVNHTTAAGNIGSRLQPDGLAEPAITWDDESGSAVAAGQWWRIEPVYDGTDLVVRVYAGHNTTGARVHTWNNLDVGRSLEITGYRYRRGVLLQQGATGPEVEERQRQLITLSYLGDGDDDGIYGQGTANAVQAFQVDYGVWPQDGEIGPETGAALDLAAWEAEGHTTPPPLYISHVAVGEGELIGPAPDWVDVEVDAEDTAEFSLSMVVEDTTKTVQDTAEFDLSVDELSVGVDSSLSDTAEFDLTSEITLKTSDEGSSNTAVFDLEIDFSVESLIPDPPPIPPQWRMAVYHPNGSLKGYLYRVLSWEASVPLNDVGALRLVCSDKDPATELINDGRPFEIGLELRRGTDVDYVEPPDCRFISVVRERDPKDRTGVVTWTLPNYGWQTRKIATHSGTLDAERVFENSTAGNIVRTLLLEQRSRLPNNPMGLEPTFTSLLDTAGQAWDRNNLSFSFGAGTTLDQIIADFGELGLVDWRVQGRNLQMYNARTVMYRNLEDDVLIRLDRDVISAPERMTYEDLALGLRIKYDNGTVWSANNTSAYWPWGGWEDFTNFSGIPDTSTVNALLESRRRATRQPREEFTRHLVLTNSTNVPLLDYNPGDRVSVERWDYVGNNIVAPLQQVHQVTLRSDDKQVLEAIVSVGGRFTPRDYRVQRTIGNITGGASYTAASGAWRRK